MTVAWRAGQFPARPLSSAREINRTAAFACAGVLSALNAQANLIIDALTWQSPIDAMATLGGIAAVIWIAMYAALRLGFEAPWQPVGRADAFLLGLAVILCLLPLSFAGKAGLLLCAGSLLWRSRAGDAARRVSLILFALTGPLIWGRILLQVLAAPVLSLDAHLAAAFAGTQAEGNLVQFANGGKSFLIGGPCSSVHNISLAIVLWTTAAAMFDLRIDKRYLAIGAAMVATMFGLNIIRLAMMAVFPAHFDLLHTGVGADVFGWSGLIGAALWVAWGVSGAAHRQR